MIEATNISKQSDTSDSDNESSASNPELGIDSDTKKDNGCRNCCKKCISRCKPCMELCKHVLLFRNLFTPWLTVVDIVTDILAIIQYFKSDTIPVQFAWALSAILFLAFRFQLIWSVVLYGDQGTSDDGFIGKITICKALMSYIPLIGCLLVNPNPFMIPLDIIASLFFFLGPLAVVYISVYKWWYWVNYLLCCGDKPQSRFDAETRMSGQTYERLTTIGIEEFVADWESIMESLPQTVIGTYVTFTYLSSPSSKINPDDLIIYVSLGISGIKLCFTVIKILIQGGHQAGKVGSWRD